MPGGPLASRTYTARFAPDGGFELAGTIEGMGTFRLDGNWSRQGDRLDLRGTLDAAGAKLFAMTGSLPKRWPVQASGTYRVALDGADVTLDAVSDTCEPRRILLDRPHQERLRSATISFSLTGWQSQYRESGPFRTNNSLHECPHLLHDDRSRGVDDDPSRGARPARPGGRPWVPLDERRPVPRAAGHMGHFAGDCTAAGAPGLWHRRHGLALRRVRPDAGGTGDRRGNRAASEPVARDCLGTDGRIAAGGGAAGRRVGPRRQRTGRLLPGAGSGASRRCVWARLHPDGVPIGVRGDSQSPDGIREGDDSGAAGGPVGVGHQPDSGSERLVGVGARPR